MKNSLYWFVRIMLLLLVVILNPFVLEKIFIPDGKISSYLFRAILWTGMSVFLILFWMSIVAPKRLIDYGRVKWKNYLLVMAISLLTLLAIEYLLRISPVRYRGLDCRQRIVFVNNLEYATSIKLNSDYFRGQQFSIPKKKNELRIFLIGDSFIFGTGVNENETINNHIESKLNKDSQSIFKVYNLGRSGSGPIEYLGVAKQFKKYNPDLIILCLYVDNDIIRSVYPENRLRFFKIMELLNKVNEAIASRQFKNRDYNCIYPWIEELKADNFYIKKACRGEINPWLLKRAAMAGDNQGYYDRLVDIFKSDTATKDAIISIKNLFKGVSFLLVIIPSKYQVSNQYFPELRKLGFIFRDDKALNRHLQDEIILWAKESGIDYLDILPYMLAEEGKEKFFYKVDDHPSPSGSLFISNLVYDKIKELKMVPLSLGISRGNN